MLEELFERRKEYKRIINFFLATRKPDQGDINQLKHIVEAYNYLEMIDCQLCLAHLKWIGLIDKTDEELNEEKHDYSPVKFGEKIEKFGEELDQVESKFVLIVQMYPNNAEVQDLLKSFKHENNVKTNCVSFDTKPVKEAKVIMDKLMEV